VNNDNIYIFAAFGDIFAHLSNPMNSFAVGSYLMIDDENVEINVLPYQ
jgi:hypothetical protein